MRGESSVDIATGWWQGIPLFSTVSRPALGRNQPHIRRVPGALTPEIKRPSMKLTTHLHLMPRQRMMKLYIHYPICLHRVVINKLRTGKSLRLPWVFELREQNHTPVYCWRNKSLSFCALLQMHWRHLRLHTGSSLGRRDMRGLHCVSPRDHVWKLPQRGTDRWRDVK
jgi:hypothetical protein